MVRSDAMQVALLADVHANLDALEAVLKHAARHGTTETWHVGDLVGYGPDPDAVVERLASIGADCVMGNHDAAAAGLLGTDDFNRLASEAAAWTAEIITPATREYLRALPLVTRDGMVTRAHGSLREPLWEYLTTIPAAKAQFAAQQTRLSIVGHTHTPLVIHEEDDGEISAEVPGEADIVFVRDGRHCINPGGVGQPRDGDPRASYAVLNLATGTASFYRVAYDIGAVQSRMRAAGLPEPLIDRLARGR